METIVFFSNKSIKIARGVKRKGRLSVERLEVFPLEEGAMLNGVITDMEIVEAVLKDAVQTHIDLFKKVRLVIDSSLIATKNIKIPTLKPKEMEKLVATEFEDTAGNYRELVVDYTMIPGENKENMLCVGLEKEVLEPYINLFKQLKIKIENIDVGLNTIIQYVIRTKAYKGKTLAINVLDGNYLLSLLFNDGRYIFSNRSRLLTERGSEAFASELSDKLSTLMQFYKAQKYEAGLNMSLYAGIDELELKMLKQYVFEPEMKLFLVAQTPNVVYRSKGQDESLFADDFLITSGFFTHKKKIDLYTAYMRHEKPKNEMKPLRKGIILPIGMIAFFLGVFMALCMLGQNLEKSLEGLNAYINDVANQQQFMKAEALSDELEVMNARLTQLENMNRAIESQPVLVSQKINKLFALRNGDIEITHMEYDEDAGVIHLMGYADTEIDSSHYVDRIKATNYFSYVDYTGYSLREMERTITTATNAAMGTTLTSTATTTTIEVFDFSVDAYLKAGD